MSKYNKEELIKLLISGETCYSIGKTYGVTENAIRKALSRFGISSSKSSLASIINNEVYKVKYTNKDDSSGDSTIEHNQDVQEEVNLEGVEIKPPVRKISKGSRAFRRLTSSELGTVGELATSFYLSRLGIHVSKPMSESEFKYDLVADLNGNLVRIQTKSVEFTKMGKSNFKLTKSDGEVYNSSEIDYFALYNYQDDALIIIPLKVLQGKRTISISMGNVKNPLDVIFWKDYLPEKTFKDYL